MATKSISHFHLSALVKVGLHDSPDMHIPVQLVAAVSSSVDNLLNGVEEEGEIHIICMCKSARL